MKYVLCALFASLLLVIATDAAVPMKLTAQDYIDIKMLSARYVQIIEHCTNKGYDYAALYTPDGEFGGTDEWDVPPKTPAKGPDRLAAAANGGPNGCGPADKWMGTGLTHIIVNTVITPTATGAAGKSYLVMLGVQRDPTRIIRLGGYQDTYVKTAKGWRFKTRWLVWAPGRSAADIAAPAPPDPTPHPFNITRSDPALDQLIAPDAKATLLAGGFGFIDGPVWVKGHDGTPGYLLASSIIDNVIYKVTPAGKVSVFLDKAGYTGDDFANDGKFAYIGRAHVLLMGPGCAGVDHEGRIVWCAGQDRTIMRQEKDGTRTVLAKGSPEGKRFNGPNDVAIAADGSIFFTDSDVGLRGGIKGPLAQMPDSVWRWKDGKVTMAVSRETLGAEPNGIALSPDDKYLYLSAGTVTPNPRIMRFPVNPDGTTGPGVLWTQGAGIGDGMKTDPRGNLWSTDAMPGTVRITAPSGKLLGLLHMPTLGDAEPRKSTCASSLAFGGDDAKTLYVTSCEFIYAIPLRAAGSLEGPAG